MAKDRHACVWRCGAEWPDPAHHPSCPTHTGVPLAGIGLLRGVGHCTLAYGDNRKGRCAWCGTKLEGRRRRWCSDECDRAFVSNHGWNWARDAALVRDFQRCQRCGRGRGNTFVLAALMAAFGVRLTPDAVPDHVWEAWRWYAVGVTLEVNHLTPIRGRHAEFGCHHHLDGLQTLCRPCHAIETNHQRRNGWAPSAPPETAEPLVLALA